MNTSNITNSSLKFEINNTEKIFESIKLIKGSLIAHTKNNNKQTKKKVIESTYFIPWTFQEQSQKELLQPTNYETL